MDRLVDRELGADVCGIGDAREALPDQARVVVVGGGLVGASVAYHLTLMGETDVLLLERNVLGSGSSWYAAGLVSRGRSSAALSELASYGVDCYARLQEETGVDVSFNQCGSLAVARTPGRWDELCRQQMVVGQLGVEAHLVGPQDVHRLWPLASPEGLVGGFHQPQDGHVNPGHAAMALARAAHLRGAAAREGVSVTGVRVEDGIVVGVETSRGPVAAEHVVLAAGLWTRDLAGAAGANVPLHAAEHVHARTVPIEGADAHLPVLRDLDGYFYVRTESGRLLVGAFEPDGRPRPVQDVAGDGFAEFEPDWDHFSGVRRLAEERVPVLSGVDYDRFLNAPESFTPDGNFCLGETAEISGLFVAAGFNSQGVIYAPGAGRALADWVLHGAPGFDAAAVDVQRFSRQQGSTAYLRARTQESLGQLYAMHWPHRQPETARDLRRTPLHERLLHAGACFGETSGWERANWYAEPGQRPEYEYSYGPQNWFERAGREHRAARQAVALFDLSSFTKVEVAGPAALAVVQELCTATMDMEPGRVRYTLMLNARGGIELDGTVTRLSSDRFLVVTPAVSQTKTLWALRRRARGRAAAVFDATSGLATIAVMGPRSRELMTRISPADFTDEALPYTRAREVEVASGHALVLRTSFVGELGYEIYPSADLAVHVYDAVVEAGRDLGLVHAGYHALDSLRCEKGYRHLGHDIGPGLKPAEAGLMFAVSERKEADFEGRSALRKGQEPRWRTFFVRLDDPSILLHHDEPVLREGRQIGQVTSGAYGWTVGGACGVALIDELEARTLGGEPCNVTVTCGTNSVPATLSPQPFYDPTGSRMR
jgi:glycine cleavage system aminomethyltransferase T/glycine/D-amino acid oxidase-like deaminating enzyme